MTRNRLEVTYSVGWYRDEEGEEALLAPDMRIDGEVMLEDVTLDLRQLVASAAASGEFWIFTCGCGEPGHKGISDPVRVRYNRGEVVWKVPSNGDYPPAWRRFTFDREQYRGAIRSALAQARDLAEAVGSKAAIGPHGFEVEDLMRLELF